MKILHQVERGVVVTLLVLLVVAVLASTVELAVVVVREIWQPPRLLLTSGSMLEVFGFFLMVLLGLELIETIRGYLDEACLHAEIVMLVAIVALSRKVILIDKEAWDPQMVLAIAAMLLALSAGYYLVKRALPPGPGPASR